MEQYLVSILSNIPLGDIIQVLFLILIVWLVRKARIMNGGLEERLKRHIDERLQQVTWRIEKREQRQQKTEYPQGLQDWQGGYPPRVPNFPPMEE